MSTITASIATLLATGITQVVKQKKPDNLTDAQKKKRSQYLKGISSLTSISIMITAALLIGEPIDTTSIEGQIETLASVVIGIIGPQGWYKMFK